MPSAYIIANVSVTDPTQYEEYKRLSSIAMKTHGAEVCVRGGKIERSDNERLEFIGDRVLGLAIAEVLEGDWAPTRIVILKFPSVEAAQQFNTSTEYNAARKSRQGIAVMRMVLVEGV